MTSSGMTVMQIVWKSAVSKGKIRLQPKKISLSFQLDSFFILVSKESSIHETLKTMSAICIEHAFVIQNIPIILSEFIKPKSNWFKNFVYDLFKTE
jgi:hypothetical protein